MSGECCVCGLASDGYDHDDCLDAGSVSAEEVRE